MKQVAQSSEKYKAAKLEKATWAEAAMPQFLQTSLMSQTNSSSCCLQTPGNSHRSVFCAWCKAWCPSNRPFPTTTLFTLPLTSPEALLLHAGGNLTTEPGTQENKPLALHSWFYNICLTVYSNVYSLTEPRTEFGALLATQMLKFLRESRLGNKLKASKQFSSEGRIPAYLVSWSYCSRHSLMSPTECISKHTAKYSLQSQQLEE